MTYQQGPSHPGGSANIVDSDELDEEARTLLAEQSEALGAVHVVRTLSSGYGEAVAAEERRDGALGAVRAEWRAPPTSHGRCHHAGRPEGGGTHSTPHSFVALTLCTGRPRALAVQVGCGTCG